MSKNHFQIVEVPVKPYLKQFILVINGAEPLAPRKDKLFGKLIYSMLEKKHGVAKETSDLLNERIKVMLDTLHHVPGADPRSNEVRADSKMAADFNNTYEQLFNQYLYSYLSAAKHSNKELKSSCIAFLQHLNIDNEMLDVDSALKRFQRQRKRINDNKRKMQKA